MRKRQPCSLIRTVAPCLFCFALCAVAVQAQDSITHLSHNSRSVAQAIAENVGCIIIAVGLIAAWMRRSARIALYALVFGGGLVLSVALYNSAQDAWAVPYSPMPLDQYAPDVQGVTDSLWFRRILGAAAALFSIYLAYRQHDINKRLVLSVGFGLALILNADAILSWLS